MSLSHAVLSEKEWEEGAKVVIPTALATPVVVGPSWQAAEDIPCSLHVPAVSRWHWDRSFMLWDLLEARRSWANLGLGKVDEKLSTVTNKNKPHSLAVTCSQNLLISARPTLQLPSNT